MTPQQEQQAKQLRDFLEKASLRDGNKGNFKINGMQRDLNGNLKAIKGILNTTVPNTDNEDWYPAQWLPDGKFACLIVPDKNTGKNKIYAPQNPMFDLVIEEAF